MDFHKNNLDKSPSPYLQQHKANPIHWQEWSEEVLEYAKKENKIVFVSVGYSTCHWCHVMASEAFSNKEIADFLNQNFISIKVDREQRPDIDQFLMSFLIETQGQGGWPLNAFLTPDLRPILALTYVPVEPKHNLPGFLQVLNFINIHKNQEIGKYSIPETQSKNVEEDKLIETILSGFDKANGGFGIPKFPPHNTLLFLLSYFENTKKPEVKIVLEKTLDEISKRGLHDHLQGGFFRYCVDGSWTIPHFEKMLYDQAMLLWVYSTAYKALGKKEYRTIAERIISCLEETFEDGLFYSGHDADTNHEEGATYLWTKEELQKTLTKEEFEKFSKIYLIKENFEGKIHLIKIENIFLPEIERKLLETRRKRKQPFVDKKFITSWNCLVGISLFISYRNCGIENSKTKSLSLFKKLLEKHYIEGKLYHSSLGKDVQKNEFLEDYASFLLFATFVFEETGEYKNVLEDFFGKIEKFRKSEKWIESANKDFFEVPAQTFDHPTPSSTSLAEMAILRAKILLDKEYQNEKYKSPLSYDFHNFGVFIASKFHIIHSPEKISWEKLPLNCIQIKSKNIQDCFGQKCMVFKTVDELVKSLKA